ncbi:MAG: penicillin-binding transpeptidase domain-containing protein [Planctomycetaceae bacterium]
MASLLDDPRRPLFSRVNQATLPPGSVFKVITAIAGMEAGEIDPLEPFDCQGYFAKPDRERCAIYRHFGVGHGPVDLEQALAESCNTYFFAVAGRVGGDSIADWGRRFGLGAPTQTDLPFEASGQVPSPSVAARSGDDWYPGSTRQLAIGQGSLTVTPLQVARLMAAIANDGWLVQPRFVRPATPQLDSFSGTAESIALVSFVDSAENDDGQRPIRVNGLSPATLAHVRRGLEATVEHPRGTGRAARLPQVRVAGKTGTAEIGGNRPDHAWFAGYVPADRPRIAFVVVIEQGGSGGRVAAPVARAYVSQLLQAGVISPTPARPE